MGVGAKGEDQVHVRLHVYVQEIAKNKRNNLHVCTFVYWHNLYGSRVESSDDSDRQWEYMDGFGDSVI